MAKFTNRSPRTVRLRRAHCALLHRYLCRAVERSDPGKYAVGPRFDERNLEGNGPMKSIDVLLLSRNDVVELALTPREVVSAVEVALREHAAGTFEMHPKIGVHPTGTDPANFIHAMPAYLRQLGACGLKWVAGFTQNHQRDLPNDTGLQVYNDTATGIPLAIMDCS